MAGKNRPKKVERTEADTARHRAIRDKFKDWHPSLEELLASGEYEGPVPPGVILDAKRLLGELRRAREEAGLSLTDMAARTGMDRAALSRLESGKQPNPTLQTVFRYFHALGQRLAWTREALPAKRPARRTTA